MIKISYLFVIMTLINFSSAQNSYILTENTFERVFLPNLQIENKVKNRFIVKATSKRGKIIILPSDEVEIKFLYSSANNYINGKSSLIVNLKEINNIFPIEFELQSVYSAIETEIYFDIVYKTESIVELEKYIDKIALN